MHIRWCKPHVNKFWVTLLLVTPLTAAACGSSNASSNAASSSSTTSAATGNSVASVAQYTGPTQNVTLMLNFTYSGHYAPFFYGKKLGYFKKEGINLTIEPGSGSLNTVQAVGSGHADFGWADAPSIITGIAAGVPVHALGAFEQTSTSEVIFFANSGIKTPADLIGKSVGITPGDALSQTFPAFLKANNIPANKVTIVHVTAAAKIATLVEHKVDAIVGFFDNQAPVVAAKGKKKASAFLYSKYGVPFLGLGLFSSNQIITSHPGLAKRMFTAVQESWQATQSNPSAAVDAMEAAVGQQLPSKSLLLTQLKDDLPTLHSGQNPNGPLGVNTKAQWAKTLSLLAQYGVVKNPGSPSEYWTSASSLK